MREERVAMVAEASEPSSGALPVDTLGVLHSTAFVNSQPPHAQERNHIPRGKRRQALLFSRNSMPELNPSSSQYAEFIQEAAEEAAAALPTSDVLRSISQLKDEYSLRISTTESELNLMVRAQVEEAASIMNLLKEASNLSADLGSAMLESQRLCETSQQSHENSGLLDTLSTTNKNMTCIIDLCEALFDFSGNAEDIELMVKEDIDLIGAHESLFQLKVHAVALQEATANSAGYAEYEGLAKTGEVFSKLAEEYEVFKNYIRTIQQTEEIFEKAVFDTIGEMKELAVESPYFLVDAIRVVELQERLDVRMEGSMPPKQYKKRLFDTVKDSIDMLFTSFTNTIGEAEADIILQVVDDQARELMTIFDFVAPIFPREYEIFEFMQQQYDSHYQIMFDKLGDCAQAYSNGDIKKILTWLRDYQEQEVALGVMQPLLCFIREKERVDVFLKLESSLREEESIEDEEAAAEQGIPEEDEEEEVVEELHDETANGKPSNRRTSLNQVTTISLDDLFAPKSEADEDDSSSTHRRSSLSKTIDRLKVLSADENTFKTGERGYMQLTRVYVGRMRELFTKWFDNLMVADAGTIPKRSETGRLYTPAAVEIFGIIDDQIAIVKEMDSGWWLFQVLRAVLEVMDHFRESFREKLLPLQEQGMEHMIAGVNNAIRCYEYAQDLSELVEDVLPENFFQKLDFDDTYNGFLAMSKIGLPMVANCIFKDPAFNAVINRLFVGQDWLRGDTIEIIIATLRDYLGDVVSFVESILTPRLIETILERTINCIFERLIRNKECLKEHPVDTVRRMEVDSSTLRDFFLEYIGMDSVERHVSPLDSLRELVAAEDPGDVIMSYTLILQAKPNFQPSYVEALLTSRSDITKKDRAELIEQCQERWESASHNQKEKDKIEADKNTRKRLANKVRTIGKVALLAKQTTAKRA